MTDSKVNFHGLPETGAFISSQLVIQVRCRDNKKRKDSWSERRGEERRGDEERRKEKRRRTEGDGDGRGRKK